MNVLVVGGAGYIGSHVCKALIQAGHKVVVFDNLSSGLRSNLQANTVFIQGDLLHYDEIITAIQQEHIDAAIHLAAFKAAGESMIVPEKYSLNNLNGSVNLINAMLECKISNLVFSSSAAVYGAPVYNPIDESHPKEPENYYGFTKLKVEEILAWYDKLHSFRSACLRYFNAAGYDVDGELKGLETSPANLLPVVMETAAGLRENMQVFGNDYPTPDGTCIRDYIHVSDLAQAHVKALEYIAKEAESINVNLGSEAGASVLEMIAAAEKITGRKINYSIVGRREGDPAELIATSALAQQKLNWRAKHSDVDSLLKTTWEAYLQNGVVKS